MQKITFLIFFSFCFFHTYSQTDSLWTRSLGGPGTEVAGTNSPNNFGNNMCASAIDAIDGGIYLTTYTPQAGGWVTTNNGNDDVWVIKLNSNGDTLWTRVFGGAESDRSYRVRAVSTGGCIVVGRTGSNTGVFSSNNGQTDGFLIRLDASGNVIWSRCYGGSQQDYLYDVAENPAGNFVACGEAGSNNGDLTGTGSGLAWVIFVNGATGAPVQSVAPQGPSSSSPNFLENFTIITRLADGSGYLCSGFTSPDFNNFNLDDIWVAKISFNGTVLWSKKYGSTNARDGSGALLDAGNNEFFIVGMLGGSGGFPNYLGGPGDGFLLKCDASTGDTIWTKNYGGSVWDYFNDGFIDNNGDLYIAGFSNSTNGWLSNHSSFGLADYWVLKLNSNGDTIYTKRFGGSDFDAAMSIAGSGMPDEFVVCGRSNSNDGWVWGNNGGRDMYVACFGSVPTSLVKERKGFSSNVYPNPANDQVNLQISSEFQGNCRITINDLSGRTIEQRWLSKNTQHQIYSIDISSYTNGFYLISLETPDGIIQNKFIKQ
jgi:hypothetical protein